MAPAQAPKKLTPVPLVDLSDAAPPARVLSTAPLQPKKAVTFADAVKAKAKKARHTVPGMTRRNILFPLEGKLPALPLDIVTALTQSLRDVGSKNTVESFVLRGQDGLAVCSTTPTQGEITVIQNSLIALGAAKAEPVVPSSRSFFKVVDVPFFAKDGRKVVPADIVRALEASPASKGNFTLVGGLPRVVRNSPKSDSCTVYFNIQDSKTGRSAAALINKPVIVFEATCFIRGAKPQPGVPLCRRCWRWGHTGEVCRSKGTFCALCRGPHRTENHREVAFCCKANPRAKPPTAGTPVGEPCPHSPSCINCGKSHAADSRDCQYWRHRFDRPWLTRRYEEKKKPKGGQTRAGTVPAS